VSEAISTVLEEAWLCQAGLLRDVLSLQAASQLVHEWKMIA
jgi:hypothetical protein